MKSNHKYQKTILDSGLTVHSISIPGAEKNYLEILVNSGSGVESLQKTGVSHYLEHMFSYGSPEWDESNLLPYFQDLGGKYNFGTGIYNTKYHAYAMPHKTHEYLNRMSTVLVNPIFSEKHVDMERRPIITEATSELDGYENSTVHHAFKLLFPNHRVSIPIIGELEHIEKITHQDLQDYYKANYVSENMHIISTGKVNHDDLVKKAEVLFSDLPQGKPKLQIEPLVPEQGMNLLTNTWKRLDVSIGFQIPSITHPHTTQYSIISQMLNRQLENTLRHKHKLVYTASSNIMADPTKSYVACNVSMYPENLEAVLDKTIEALEDFYETTTRKEIDIFLAHEEEYIAENINNPELQGQFLSFNLMFGKGYVPYENELKTAQLMSENDIKSRITEIFTSNIVGTMIGPVQDMPDIESKIEKMRSNLGLEKRNLTTGLKPSFDLS